MKRGFESRPPSSTTVKAVGCHQFRNHFGYYLELAAAGCEIEVTRRGRPYARLIAAGRRSTGGDGATAGVQSAHHGDDEDT